MLYQHRGHSALMSIRSRSRNLDTIGVRLRLLYGDPPPRKMHRMSPVHMLWELVLVRQWVRLRWRGTARYLGSIESR